MHNEGLTERARDARELLAARYEVNQLRNHDEDLRSNDVEVMMRFAERLLNASSHALELSRDYLEHYGVTDLGGLEADAGLSEKNAYRTRAWNQRLAG